MEKITTVLDGKNVTKELAKKNRLSIFSSLAAGLLCVVLYFVFSSINNSWGDALNIIMLVVGVVCLILCGLMVFKIYKAIKHNDKEPITCVYDFQEEYILMEAFKKDGTKVEESRLFYKELLGYYERNGYVFLKVKENVYLPITKTPELISFLASKGLGKN